MEDVYMLRKIAFMTAIALGGSLAMTTTAQANPVDIPFNGTVEPECAFGVVVDGILAPVGDPLPTALSSLPGNGGTPGSTDVICNADADINLSASKVDGPDFTESSLICTVDGNPALPIDAGVSTDLTVNLEVESVDLIPPGDYEYICTLTAVL